MEYELFDELPSRIRTFATVGRVEFKIDSFGFVLVNELPDVDETEALLFDLVSFEVSVTLCDNFVDGFLIDSASFVVLVLLVGESQRLE